MPSQYCTFWIGDLLFGIRVEHVQEVIMQRTITPVPLATASIRGLMNLRGQILAVIDLRTVLLLNVEPFSVRSARVNIIVRTQTETLSFLVDRAGDVLDVDESQFVPPPSTLEGIAGEVLSGVYQLDSHLLHVLEVDALLEQFAPASNDV